MSAMIDTTMGPLPADKLERRDSLTFNDRERTKRIEYWFMGRCVRSDVHITLLQGQILPSIQGHIA